jgi:hypothetical protein
MTHADERATARKTSRSADRLAAGTALLLVGAAVAMIGNAAMAGVAVILGIVAAAVGATMLVAGIHRLADNIDQGMRALVERD